MNVQLSERIIVLVGPSGGGKTQVADALKQQLPINRVITCTTRSPRPGEVDGREYHFLDRESFCSRIFNGDFAEYDTTRPELYGMLSEDVGRALDSTSLVVLVLNIVGAETIARIYPGAQVFCITAPPEQLIDRLTKRGDPEGRIPGLQAELEFLENSCVRDVIHNIDGELEGTVRQICDIIKVRLNVPLCGKPRC
jgi:guanylate kinase